MQIQDGGRERPIKNRFWLYLGAVLADQCEVWIRDEESHADIGLVFKTTIFAKSRWRTAAILKITLSISAVIIRFLSNWVRRCEFPFREWSFDKIRNFINLRWRTDGRHIENRSLAISRRHFSRYVCKLDGRCRNACKQRSRDQSSNFRHSTWRQTHVESSFFRRLGRHIRHFCNKLKLSNVFQ